MGTRKKMVIAMLGSPRGRSVLRVPQQLLLLVLAAIHPLAAWAAFYGLTTPEVLFGMTLSALGAIACLRLVLARPRPESIGPG